MYPIKTVQLKKRFRYRSILLLFVIVPFLTLSCHDDKQTTPTPTLTSLSPDSGLGGTDVVIIGKHFGKNSNDISVAFGNKHADIIDFSSTKLKVESPSGFNDIAVDVTVNVDGKTSNAKPFFYKNHLPPSITSTTASCFYHSTVVIEGHYFSSDKGKNSVKFGTEDATITYATKDSLIVTTPDLGHANSVDITVSRDHMVSEAKTIPVDFDQNRVATYNWTTDTIQPGLIYKTGQFTLFGSTLRRMYILDVTLNATNTLGIGFSTNNKATVTMCKNYGAVAGTNAGYFKLGNSSDKNPYIRINGTRVQAGDLNVSPLFTNSALTIHNNIATVRKFTRGGRSLNLLAAAIPVSEAENVIVSGPMLIRSGVIEDLNMSTSHNYSHTARTGFGVTANGKRIFLIVVDTGDNGNAVVTGVSTLQLAKILQALGSFNAMNFDGGGSSTMFVKNHGGNGRVNFPPYGGTYQRPVASVIYIK